MQASERLYKLRCVKTGSPLTELLVLSQMVEQLASIEEIHHKVQFGRRLERIVQFDDERAVDLFKDISLS